MHVIALLFLLVTMQLHVFAAEENVDVEKVKLQLVQTEKELRDARIEQARLEAKNEVLLEEIKRLNTELASRTSTKAPTDKLQLSIDALKKLESGASLGISFEKYSDLLREHHDVILEGIREATNHNVRVPLQRALTAYVDAKRLWSASLEQRSRIPYLPDGMDFIVLYELDDRDSTAKKRKRPVTLTTESIPMIWEFAARALGEASFAWNNDKRKQRNSASNSQP